MPDYKYVLSVLRENLVDPVFVETIRSAAETHSTEKIIHPTVGRPDPF